jgi:hypothetical protein
MLTLEVKRIKNCLTPSTDQIIPLNLSVNGYLDDTTWFASSLEQLNEKLILVNKFYNLADIKINKHKYKLLTNVKNQPQETSISIIVVRSGYLFIRIYLICD